MTLPDYFAILTGFAGIVAIFYRASAAQSKADFLVNKVEDLGRALERQEARHSKELQEIQERAKQNIERQDQQIEGLKFMLDFHEKTGASSARLVSQLIETLEKYKK